MKALAFVTIAALLGGCEPGWELQGEVVPEVGVDRGRQLLVLLSTDVELYLGQPAKDGFTKRARVLASVEDMNAAGDAIRFSFFNVGCSFEKFQVVALAPKARVRLPGRDSEPEPVKLKAGDYLAKTELLDVTDCGVRRTQRIVLPLAAREWSAGSAGSVESVGASPAAPGN